MTTSISPSKATVRLRYRLVGQSANNTLITTMLISRNSDYHGAFENFKRLTIKSITPDCANRRQHCDSTSYIHTHDRQDVPSDVTHLATESIRPSNRTLRGNVVFNEFETQNLLQKEPGTPYGPEPLAVD